jgi:hypothetical protein
VVVGASVRPAGAARTAARISPHVPSVEASSTTYARSTTAGSVSTTDLM